MLTQLSASNFKSWKAIDDMRLAPITGLFGTNSSGKTSILQLLLLFKQTIESSDRAAVLEFGGDRALTNLGTFRDVVFQHRESSDLSFGISWERSAPLSVYDPVQRAGVLFSSKSMGFRTDVKENGADKLLPTRFTYTLGENKLSMQRKGTTGQKYELVSDAGDFRFVRTQGRAWDLPLPVKCYGFPDQVYAYYQNAGFLADLQLAFEELFRHLYYLGPLRDFPQRHYTWAGSEPADMGRRGERVVDALLASRQKGRYISPGPHRKRQSLEERIAYWLKELGLIHSFSVEPIAEGSNLYQVKVQKSASSANVLIPDVGFGVSQILPVLVLCYYVPDDSIILLEQPEIHLHPSVQSGLADVFIDVVRNRNVQIILESHSEHLLRRLQRRVADRTIEPNDTALYFCNVENEGSVLTPLDVSLFGDIENWPTDFFGDEFGEMAAITLAAMKRAEAGTQ